VWLDEACELQWRLGYLVDGREQQRGSAKDEGGEGGGGQLLHITC
jgi:hypothetical protein